MSQVQTVALPSDASVSAVARTVVVEHVRASLTLEDIFERAPDACDRVVQAIRACDFDSRVMDPQSHDATTEAIQSALTTPELREAWIRLCDSNIAREVQEHRAIFQLGVEVGRLLTAGR
jgi:hypothetical protein